MRITEAQHKAVIKELKLRFGESSQIWLFGSRVDDAQHGGDVDLYVDAEIQMKAQRLHQKLAAGVALEKIFGGAKVDLIVRFPDEKENAIFRIVKKQGIAL